MSQRAAVLGHPIGHSKSPALHGSAYAKLGVDISYSAIDVTVEQLPDFMKQLESDRSWCGLSVTMPLKSAMFGAVDEARGAAAHLGVVNTVVFETSGSRVRRIGYNTDVEGIVEAVRYAGVRTKPNAVILGGGGTSAAAIAALHQLGSASAEIFVRDVSRTAEAKAAASAVGLPIEVRPMEGAAASAVAADLVISTLPPRAADGIAAELSTFPAARSRAEQAVLLDVAYDPWPSKIAEAWGERGGVVVPGLEMLLYQAVEQVRRFAGLDGEVTADVIDVMCDSVGLPRRVL
ncbi:shikimate dehydrogenase [Arthrobacter sp. M4]|uniref:shikimate dehydrogenase n=1 Tax=Arthrobacter sp. M4 TaxID=218160 RepID=UPI001CDD32E0|nr:shikimate dehydrogenase [Arthrobacter sp. M4]MCA4131351.1 shikimate dehydrogenase [Arthrobacter sp. M4]